MWKRAGVGRLRSAFAMSFGFRSLVGAGDDVNGRSRGLRFKIILNSRSSLRQ